MPGIICLSDVHLLWNNPVCRCDNLVEVQFKKLSRVFERAINLEASVVIAGDFTDVPRSWHLLPAIVSFFNMYPEVDVYAVYGQHDNYLYSKNAKATTMLGVLQEAGYVTILDEKPTIVGRDVISGAIGANLYGASFGADIPKPKKSKRENILVVHAPIYHKDKVPGAKYEASEFLKKHSGYDFILCGDIHARFVCFKGDRIIANTGPLLRKTADEAMFTYEPKFFHYNWLGRGIDNIETFYVPHKAAKEVLSRAHIDTKAKASEHLLRFVESVSNVSASGRKGIVSNLAKFFDENDIDEEVVAELSKVAGDIRRGDA